MDTYIVSLAIVGLLLLAVTLGSGWIARLPLSYALIYLIVGILLGSYGFGIIEIRPDTQFLERISEFVVIVSVFGCGLKINRPLKLWAWQSTIRLIGLLMPLTIAAMAAIAHYVLGMGWGAAVLLGAILAPTDPVLASEVQLAHVKDKDELRFALTSEGGLNDSLAFPFVYFGIYLFTKPDLNSWFFDWVAVDLVWAIAAGIIMGILVARAIVWLDRVLQKRRQVDDLLEDFIALSIILLTYSLTELVNGYGFLAVFMAGLIVQNSYSCHQEKRMQQLEFTEQVEKLLEVAAIVILGTVLLYAPMVEHGGKSLLTAGLIFLVVRPIGVWLSFIGSDLPKKTRSLMGWFGIRGLGSIYYLTYSLGKGVTGKVAEEISWITLTVVVLSIIFHGITAAPLMAWYESVKRHGNSAANNEQ